MTKKKFYAVKTGRKTGVFKSWAECSENVIGFSGAIFKSFETVGEANTFLGITNNDNEVDKTLNNKMDKLKYKSKAKKDKVGYDVEPIRSKANVFRLEKYIEPESLMNKYDFIAFVDGSYNEDVKVYGSGVIVLNETQGSYDTYLKAGYDEWDQWNIVGELEAVKLAIIKAQQLKKNNVAIYHDLKNISLWATGEWKAKNRYTQEYVRVIEEASKTLNICFVKVKGHSNESIYNDLADKAAKEAIIKYTNF